MAGIYFDDNKFEKDFQKWSNKIISSQMSWEGNYLHIDEIAGLNKLKKSEWINTSFIILDILLKEFKSIDSLILFMHFDLKYSLKKMSLDNLSMNWLIKNVSDFTPPSLHFTSLDYYNDFYEKELVVCKPDENISKVFHSTQKLEFFYRTYYDADEEMYSREIYVFIKRKHSDC